MREIVFKAPLFGEPAVRRQSEDIMRLLLEALTRADEMFLAVNPRAPSLYGSGVVYRRETIGVELWQGIEECLRLGYGDCEDLASWRAAELRRQGIAARADFSVQQHGDLLVYHIFVLHPNGTKEDPSKLLGMGKVA